VSPGRQKCNDTNNNVIGASQSIIIVKISLHQRSATTMLRMLLLAAGVLLPRQADNKQVPNSQGHKGGHAHLRALCTGDKMELQGL